MTETITLPQDWKSQDEEQIRTFAKQMGLDSHGPKSTLLSRIRMYLQINPSHVTIEQPKTTSGSADHSKNSQGKNRRRRKKKNGKVNNDGDGEIDESGDSVAQENEKIDKDLDVEIEYVPQSISKIIPQPDEFQQYAEIMAKFMGLGDSDLIEGERMDEDQMDDTGRGIDGEHGSGEEEKPLSKKKLKKMKQMTVAQLKTMVRKPEVVEWVDVTAKDPLTLVTLKSYRNTVPVPIHWAQKRKYLQNKRGIEKAPFDLPDFIKATGIQQMRQAVREKEELAGAKGRARQKLNPKMGKLEIDYQKLHDAFFRWQTRPKLTIHGDMYYEGKEYETKLKLKQPGALSEELKTALNMPPLAPPPWLINMQRYGPPPSYPLLKIPGLNSPIPAGAQWGFQPGGWGKPPVDESNRPLYGDVFGVEQEHDAEVEQTIERTLWGELEPEVEEEEEEEVESEEEEEEEEEEPESVPFGDGLVTPSGLSSVPSGLETPDFIELRKDVKKSAVPAPEQPTQKALYTVVPEKGTSIKGFMGSQHGYDISSAYDPSESKSSSATKRKFGVVGSDVDVAFNPEDLEEGLDQEALQRKYEQQVQAAKASVTTEDFSDMVAEHAQKQASKRQKKDESKSKKKEFKF